MSNLEINSSIMPTSKPRIKVPGGVVIIDENPYPNGNKPEINIPGGVIIDENPFPDDNKPTIKYPNEPPLPTPEEIDEFKEAISDIIENLKEARQKAVITYDKEDIMEAGQKAVITYDKEDIMEAGQKAVITYDKEDIMEAGQKAAKIK